LLSGSCFQLLELLLVTLGNFRDCLPFVRELGLKSLQPPTERRQDFIGCAA
jgi:hypothetical protein